MVTIISKNYYIKKSLVCQGLVCCTKFNNVSMQHDKKLLKYGRAHAENLLGHFYSKIRLMRKCPSGAKLELLKIYVVEFENARAGTLAFCTEQLRANSNNLHIPSTLSLLPNCITLTVITRPLNIMQVSCFCKALLRPFQAPPKPLNNGFVVWWERMDSNHRSEAQQIYSLPRIKVWITLTMCINAHFFPIVAQ